MRRTPGQFASTTRCPTPRSPQPYGARSRRPLRRATVPGMTDQLPVHPFTTAECVGLGISQHALERYVKEGVVRRAVRGCYVRADLTDTLELRAKSVARVLKPHQVVTDRTAAWLHGIDTLTYAEHDVLPPIDVCSLRGSGPSQRAGVDGHTRDLSARDIAEIHGVRVTTPLRTALDLGCLLKRREAMAALDAFCREHHLPPESLAREAVRFRRRRGVVQLRELIARVDPRAESARESWTRLAIQDAALPLPEPQVWIVIDGIPTYRLDLAYRRRRIAVEYDGFDSHDREQEQIEYDESRRRWLCDNGWTIIVIRVGDFTGDNLDRWLKELRAALEPSYSNLRRMERNSRLTRR